MFYMYVVFRVPNWPKICIVLGLGLCSTFGHPLPSPPPPPSSPLYVPGSSTPGDFLQILRIRFDHKGCNQNVCIIYYMLLMIHQIEYAEFRSYYQNILTEFILSVV